MEILSALESICRWGLGIQFVFWGLNGFFMWIKFENQPQAINNFVLACIQTKFIMPFVKVFEIIAGLMLILNFLPSVALLMLYPIVAVVVLLHLLHNLKKAYEVVLPLGVPYLYLCLYYFIK